MWAQSGSDCIPVHGRQNSKIVEYMPILRVLICPDHSSISKSLSPSDWAVRSWFTRPSDAATSKGVCLSLETHSMSARRSISTCSAPSDAQGCSINVMLLTGSANVLIGFHELVCAVEFPNLLEGRKAGTFLTALSFAIITMHPNKWCTSWKVHVSWCIIGLASASSKHRKVIYCRIGANVFHHTLICLSTTDCPWDTTNISFLLSKTYFLASKFVSVTYLDGCLRYCGYNRVLEWWPTVWPNTSQRIQIHWRGPAAPRWVVSRISLDRMPRMSVSLAFCGEPWNFLCVRLTSFTVNTESW